MRFRLEQKQIAAIRKELRGMTFNLKASCLMHDSCHCFLFAEIGDKWDKCKDKWLLVIIERALTRNAKFNFSFFEKDFAFHDVWLTSRILQVKLTGAVKLIFLIDVAAWF